MKCLTHVHRGNNFGDHNLSPGNPVAGSIFLLPEYREDIRTHNHSEI